MISNSTEKLNERNHDVESGVEVDSGVSADVEYEPDTLNLQGGGRFVEVTVESTPEGVDLANTDLSTVYLNEEVDAETDERYGFVRNPVEDDIFKAKFPREEVSEILEKGETVTVTITGETEGDVLIVGGDDIRVIDPASDEAQDIDCPPGEPVGPHEDAQGVAHGPLECPGGHSDKHPGRGVGPDGSSSGHDSGDADEESRTGGGSFGQDGGGSKGDDGGGPP